MIRSAFLTILLATAFSFAFLSPVVVNADPFGEPDLTREFVPLDPDQDFGEPTDDNIDMDGGGEPRISPQSNEERDGQYRDVLDKTDIKVDYKQIDAPYYADEPEPIEPAVE